MQDLFVATQSCSRRNVDMSERADIALVQRGIRSQ